MATERGKDRRPYFTVSLEFFDHPKTLALSDAAVRHVLEVWAYCGRFKTDGQVPRPILDRRGPEVAAELTEGGWIETREDGTLWCHDYLDHQPSREEIETRMEANRAKMARGGTKGAHTTHHVNRGRWVADCEWCQRDAAGAPPEDDPMA